MLQANDLEVKARDERMAQYRAEREKIEAAEREAAKVAADRLSHIRAKQTAGKKLTPAEAATLAKADTDAATAKAAEEQKQRDARRAAWIRAADLECEMQGQMAAATAGNPRVLIDIIAAATGAQVRNTCIEMKRAQLESMQF
jgi:hypothetical protein